LRVTIDHLVLWVEDPARSLEFYAQVLGLEPLRAEAFRAGTRAFPAVRLSSESILDLMPRFGAEFIGSAFGGEGSAGNRVHHLCLALERAEYQALEGRLAAAGVQRSPLIPNSAGARGAAAEAFYFLDPDGNVLEVRWYA
jgi:catechol 2,3-dioxygenase-like lactoylglutathione lyase family enzyme